MNLRDLQTKDTAANLNSETSNAPKASPATSLG